MALRGIQLRRGQVERRLRAEGRGLDLEMAQPPLRVIGLDVESEAIPVFPGHPADLAGMPTQPGCLDELRCEPLKPACSAGLKGSEPEPEGPMR